MITTLLLLAAVATGPDGAPQLAPGPWRAWLDTPGGELPFGLHVEAGAVPRVWVENPPERIAVPIVRQFGNQFVFEFDYYDSRLAGTIAADGRRLTGRWRKRRGGDRWEDLPFHAVAGAAPRFAARPGEVAPLAPLPEQWRVRFASDPAVAIGRFATRDDGQLTGTFLTTTGDYRYLTGTRDGATLRLSCFDGAHAFLFGARLEHDALSGDFWSGGQWHDTWTATPDAAVELPDAFGLTRWQGEVALAAAAFPDLDGRTRSLDDPAFRGPARLIEIFGTWCPNCHDASTYLVELDRRYRHRGLRILALAFEHGGQLQRDTAQVRTYVSRLGIDYPVLVAGPSAKSAAGARVPFLDAVRSYPTFVFIDGDGTVRGVYTGFSGPATGPAHDHLRAQFEGLIEKMLGGAADGVTP